MDPLFHPGIPLVDLFPMLLSELQPRLVQVHSEIKGLAPDATVFVLGYPQLLPENISLLSALTCPAFTNLILTNDELAFIRKATRQLNALICEVASELGVHFVSVEEHFDDHEACVPNILIIGQRNWIHFLTPEGGLAGVLHPNRRGQREYAVALNRFIKAERKKVSDLPSSGLPPNPSGPLTCPSPLPVATRFAAVGANEVAPALPRFGDLEISLVGAPGCPEADTLAPGEGVRIIGGGFEPGAAVGLSLTAKRGAFERSLGTVTAGTEGEIDAVVTVPDDNPTTGFGNLVATGLGDHAGSQFSTTLVRLTTVLGNDADGDGIPDLCDVCPGLVDLSQTDGDGDKLGDGCDPCPFDSENDFDGDGTCGDADACEYDALNDADADGHCANADNCPTVANPNQLDTDGNGLGDACEQLLDVDGKGIVDVATGTLSTLHGRRP